MVRRSSVGSLTRRRRKRFERHLYIYSLSDTWKGAGVSFTVGKDGAIASSKSDEKYARRDDRPKDHSHFVVFNFTGDGKYIRRNRFGTDVEVRQCSIWALGPEFAAKVMKSLGTIP